jgi:hypothetical protein
MSPIPKYIGRGGNRHPQPLGFFVRDILSGGGPTTGSNIYRQYKAAVQGEPYTGKRGEAKKSGPKRRVGSYEYVSHFLHVAESLGLIRRVEGGTQPAVEHTANGYDPGAPALAVKNFAPAQFWEIVSGKEGDSRWADVWGSKYPSCRIKPVK